MKRLSNKDAAEIIPIEFRFNGLLSAISNAVISVDVVDGTDPAASAILSGSPIINGTSVIQRVRNGVNFVDYLITCTATSGVDTYVEEAVLPVRPAVMS